MESYANFIGGEWVQAAAGKTFQTLNPADRRETVGQYALSGAEEVQSAIRAAQESFPGWRSMTPVARGRILSKVGTAIENRKNQLAELLTREEGKTLPESQGEVQRAADIFRFFGGLSYTLGGETFPHDLPQNFIYTRKEPLGVVGLITPWNFPIAIPAWKMAPALLAGNAVVIKPASQAPAMTAELCKAFQAAGLPKGVLNLVTGDGKATGTELAANPGVAGLSFTGSYAVGRQIYSRLAERMARAQMEMGGKNPTIVLADADLDLAAALVCKAGFGLTGQACTATSRVIVEKGVLEAFTKKLVERTRALRVGPGLAQGVDMGPAVNQPELEGNFEHIDHALKEGAEVIFGGQRLTEGDLAHGFFMQPTILGQVQPAMRIAREEVFGPVVALIAVNDFPEAMRVANEVDVGLSASIVTRDFKKAMLYAEQIESGVVKVNQISTGLALQAPFGGFKKSSSNSFKEQGAAALDFYTRIKTIYLDYSS